ncbi:CaiB/BaiF CoA transferase family protein [Chloroflexota bacterium]
MTEQALKGVKVAAFTWLTTGPTLTKYLADHGATVVKVESHTRPELLRTAPPFKDGKPGIDRSGYFNLFNINQRSVGINLQHPSGIEVAKKLVAWANIVVENFRSGILPRMGLGYEDIRKINPDVVMLSITMVGQRGPIRSQPGIGVQLVSYAGFTNITGWPDRGPTQPYGAYTDIPGPALGAAALMAALIKQRLTGKGQHLDVSQYETGLWFLEPLIMDCLINGRASGRQGNACACWCPHNAYPCRGEDRWVAISITSEEQWQVFRQLLGNPDWLEKPELQTQEGRKQHEDELDIQIGKWTSNFSAEEVMTRMQAAGIPAGVVENSQDLLADPQLKHRNYFWEMEHAEMGNFHHQGESFTMSETPAQPVMPAPTLGEHTEYVCREMLGMTDEEFVTLLADGAIN